MTHCLSLGVDPNARGLEERTVLHIAAENSDKLEIIAVLLDPGADVNARDVYDETPCPPNTVRGADVACTPLCRLGFARSRAAPPSTVPMTTSLPPVRL